MSPNRINTCRGIGTWLIRAVALTLLATGAYLILKRIALAVVNGGDFSTAFLTWEGIGEEQSFYRGLAMLVVGGLLALLSDLISRWIFAAHPSGCPRCGYEKVDQGRCPECGLTGFDTNT